MKKIILILFCIYFVAGIQTKAENEYTLKSPSGLITIEDPDYAKLFNIPITPPQQITPKQQEEKDEFLKRQIEFLENTELQRLYMDEFYFMRAPYRNFYRYYQ